MRVFNTPDASLADARFGSGGYLTELVEVLLVLVHLVVRDSLAGHAAYLRFVFEGPTVAPPPGPARFRPLTGHGNCRQPGKRDSRLSLHEAVTSHLFSVMLLL